MHLGSEAKQIHANEWSVFLLMEAIRSSVCQNDATLFGERDSVDRDKRTADTHTWKTKQECRLVLDEETLRQDTVQQA